MGHDVEHHQPVLHATARRYFVTENQLLAVVVGARIEGERSGLRPQPVSHARIHNRLGRSAGTAADKMKAFEAAGAKVVKSAADLGKTMAAALGR